MGIDPMTHKPIVKNAFGSGCDHSEDAANLSHTVQWETIRLQSETRLVPKPLQNQLASLASRIQLNNKPTAPPANPQCLDVLTAWQRIVFSLFSTSVGCLESSTSFLNSSEIDDQLANIPALGVQKNSTATMLEFATDNVTCNRTAGMAKFEGNSGNGRNSFEKLNQTPQVKESLDSSMAFQFQEMSSHSCANSWFVTRTYPWLESLLILLEAIMGMDS